MIDDDDKPRRYRMESFALSVLEGFIYIYEVYFRERSASENEIFTNKEDALQEVKRRCEAEMRDGEAKAKHYARILKSTTRRIATVKKKKKAK